MFAKKRHINIVEQIDIKEWMGRRMGGWACGEHVTERIGGDWMCKWMSVSLDRRMNRSTVVGGCIGGRGLSGWLAGYLK